MKLHEVTINGVADNKSKYYLPSSALIALPAKEVFFTHFLQLPVIRRDF